MSDVTAVMDYEYSWVASPQLHLLYTLASLCQLLNKHVFLKVAELKLFSLVVLKLLIMIYTLTVRIYIMTLKLTIKCRLLKKNKYIKTFLRYMVST